MIEDHALRTQPPDDYLETSSPPKFKVAIIYETAPDGVRAKRFCDQLAAELSGGLGLALNLNVWNFHVLEIPEIRNIAASAAAAADVVIFSTSGTVELPPQVEEWIETWSCLVDFGHPAVVTLHANAVAATSAIRAELLRVATRKGLDYFSQTDCGKDTIRYASNFQPRGQGRLNRGESAACGKSPQAVSRGREAP